MGARAGHHPAALALTGGMKVEEDRKAELAVSFLESLAGITLSLEEQEVIAAFFFGHLRLDAEQKLQMQEQLARLEPVRKEKIMTHINPFVEIGIEKGRLQGEIGLVLRLLRRRFGMLDAEDEAMVKSLPVEQVEDLGDALLGFQCLQDLNSWFAKCEKLEVES